MVEIAPLGLGYWSDWITPPPMWVAVPYQKVPNNPISTIPNASQASGSGTLVPSIDRLTAKVHDDGDVGIEVPALHSPEIVPVGGTALNYTAARPPTNAYSRPFGYYPDIVSAPPYGTAGQVYTPTDLANYTLIQNTLVGGFETGWTSYWTKGADLTTTQVTEQKTQGTGCGLLTRTGTGANSFISLRSEGTYSFGPLTAGYRYTFSIWIRGKVNSPNMRIEVYDQLGSYATTTYVPATQDWTLHTISFIPAVTRNHTFIVRMGPGTVGDAVYVDDCQIYRTDVPRSTVEAATVPHANRSFQYAFNVSSRHIDLFEDNGYWGFSGRPQYLWPWIQTGVREPNTPTYPETGGYGGGYSYNYSADASQRWIHTSNSYSTWNGYIDKRGRSTIGIYAGFYYSYDYTRSGWTDPGTCDGYVGLQSGAQWFDWSHMSSISNWEYFHPSTLIGEGAVIPCAYYGKVHYAYGTQPTATGDYFQRRVQFQNSNVQLLNSKLIFETSPLHPPSGVDTRPGYYASSFINPGPGDYRIYRSSPTPTSTYLPPVDNDRGVYVAKVIPTTFDVNGTITAVSWESDGPTLTPFTYTETDMDERQVATYTHFGAEIDIDLLSLYPDGTAGFGLHSSYAMNEPVDPQTFIVVVVNGNPGAPDQSVSTRLHGAFQVLVQVQLPPFRYVIPWGTPNDEVPGPMRLQQRDDGRGGYQGHARIKTSGVNPSSPGLRIEGYNTYW